MAEGLVGLGHLVRVFASLDGRAEPVHGIDEFRCELFAHAFAVAPAGRLDEPADTERKTAVAPDLDRDLVGGAADAARFDFDDGRRVPHRRLEHFEARPVRLRLRTSERLTEDPLREVALAVR